MTGTDAPADAGALQRKASRMLGFNRRTFVQLSAAELALAGLGVPAGAQSRDAITLASPSTSRLGIRTSR